MGFLRKNGLGENRKGYHAVCVPLWRFARLCAVEKILGIFGKLFAYYPLHYLI